MLLNLSVKNREESLFGINESYVFEALKDYFEIEVSQEDQESFSRLTNPDEKLSILRKYCDVELNVERMENEQI